MRGDLLLLAFSLLPVRRTDDFFAANFLCCSFYLLRYVSSGILALGRGLCVFIIMGRRLVGCIKGCVSIVLFRRAVLN